MRSTKYDISVAPRYHSNEAPWDRALRGVGGGALLWIGAGPLSGTGLGLVLSTVGAIFLVTAIVGWCPLYAALHMATVHGAGDRDGSRSSS